jgi:oxygen-independent coproporphyrinogen-3 oxidase
MNRRLETPRAAYVHVPFCRHHCGYCNFTVIASRDDLIDRYLQALAIELASLASPREVESLYLGGGTPSHLSPAQLRELLGRLREWFSPAGSFEYTLEANPIDMTPDRLNVMREFGINRISLGIQSFQPDKLASLERDHRGPEIVRALHNVREHIGNMSIDLIFGAPGETEECWLRDLETLIAHRPQHVSIYGLTIERGSRFFGRVRKKQFERLDDETERAMYLTAIDTLTGAGYEHYEVSNFALPGFRSRHNEAYWTGRTYEAFGPGASRFVAGRRETNHRSVVTYLRRVMSGESPVAEAEQLEPEDAARERLVFALRRIEGIDKEEFRAETGFRVSELGGPALERFAAWGLLEDTPRNLRLTRDGLVVSDALWPEFLRR